MAHTVGDKKNVTSRVRRIRGQLNAIERAVLDEKDSYLILQTAAACRGALNSLMAEILEGHIRFHLLERGTGSPAARRKAAREVIQIVRAFLR
jgi:DNA-binding FrmR family transcriptional regulator